MNKPINSARRLACRICTSIFLAHCLFRPWRQAHHRQDLHVPHREAKPNVAEALSQAHSADQRFQKEAREFRSRRCDELRVLQLLQAEHRRPNDTSPGRWYRNEPVDGAENSFLKVNLMGPDIDTEYRIPGDEEYHS